MRIIFATGNKDKIREINEIMKDSGVEIISMKDAGINIDVEENGTTFEENALIKARAIAKVSGEYTMADDSGLEIDYLDKAPGIYSARFMGHDTSYDVKNQALLEKLKGVPEEKRTARYVCAVALVRPDMTEEVVRETMEGYIGYEQRGTNGFGFDPIFMVPEYNKSGAELTPDEKNAISHRGKALRSIKKYL